MSLAMVGGRLAVAAGDFSLCLSECLLRDDSLVVILYVILRQLAGIFLGYACQYILDKCLFLDIAHQDIRQCTRGFLTGERRNLCC